MMKFNHISRAVEYYDNNLKSFLGEVSGLDASSIQNYEEKLDVKLPSAYVEFLRWYGETSGGIFSGSNFGLEFFSRNRIILEEILEYQKVNLAHQSSPIVFYSHQGYIASWFHCDSENAGPVYTISDSEGDTVKLIAESFEQYLMDSFTNTYKHYLEFPKAFENLSKK